MVSVTDVVDQGKQSQVLRARDITRSLEPCLSIPGVLQSYKDSTVLAEVRLSLKLLSTTCCPQDEQTTHKKASHCIVSLLLLRCLVVAVVYVKNMSAAGWPRFADNDSWCP